MRERENERERGGGGVIARVRVSGNKIIGIREWIEIM